MFWQLIKLHYQGMPHGYKKKTRIKKRKETPIHLMCQKALKMIKIWELIEIEKNIWGVFRQKIGLWRLSKAFWQCYGSITWYLDGHPEFVLASHWSSPPPQQNPLLDNTLHFMLALIKIDLIYKRFSTMVIADLQYLGMIMIC